jgi:hypothetical protein
MRRLTADCRTPRTAAAWRKLRCSATTNACVTDMTVAAGRPGNLRPMRLRSASMPADRGLKISSIPLFLYSFIPLFLYSFIPLFLYSFIPFVIPSLRFVLAGLACDDLFFHLARLHDHPCPSGICTDRRNGHWHHAASPGSVGLMARCLAPFKDCSERWCKLSSHAAMKRPPRRDVRLAHRG